MEALSVLATTPAIGEVTALDRYVSALDSSYRYELIETIPGDGYAARPSALTALCCGAWTRLKKAQRCRRSIIAGKRLRPAGQRKG